MPIAVPKLKPSLWRRFRKDNRASVAIEVGILMPFFLMFMGITAETGLIFFKEYAIQSGVQDVSRYIRTGSAQTAAAGGSSLAVFKKRVCHQASIVTDCVTKLNVYIDSRSSFATLRTSAPNFATGNTNSVNCGGPNQPVIFVATYDHQFMMPGMKYIFENTSLKNVRRLTGFTMFRNEPFPPSTPAAC